MNATADDSTVTCSGTVIKIHSIFLHSPIYPFIVYLLSIKKVNLTWIQSKTNRIIKRMITRMYSISYRRLWIFEILIILLSIQNSSEIHTYIYIYSNKISIHCILQLMSSLVSLSTFVIYRNHRNKQIHYLRRTSSSVFGLSVSSFWTMTFGSQQQQKMQYSQSVSCGTA